MKEPIGRKDLTQRYSGQRCSGKALPWVRFFVVPPQNDPWDALFAVFILHGGRIRELEYCLKVAVATRLLSRATKVRIATRCYAREVRRMVARFHRWSITPPLSYWRVATATSVEKCLPFLQARSDCHSRIQAPQSISRLSESQSFSSSGSHSTSS